MAVHGLRPAISLQDMAIWQRPPVVNHGHLDLVRCNCLHHVCCKVSVRGSQLGSVAVDRAGGYLRGCLPVPEARHPGRATSLALCSSNRHADRRMCTHFHASRKYLVSGLTIRSSRDRFAARLHGDVYHSAVPRSGPA